METYLSSMTLQIRYCQQFSHRATWRQDKTWPDHTIYYICDGTLDVDVSGTVHPAKQGDVIFLFAGDHGTMTAKTNCRFLMICFRMDVGNEHYLFRRLNSAGVYPNGILSDAGEALCDGFSAEKQNPLRFTPRQYGAFTVFLAELMKCAGKHTPFHKPAPKFSDWKLHQLLRHMEATAPAMIPIQELAERMEMSEKYFIQYFHRQVGCTPGQYMNRQRMYLASELLSDARLTLDEIAHRLNYSDRYSFSKAFRKYYEESPGNFRDRIKTEK